MKRTAGEQNSSTSGGMNSRSDSRYDCTTGEALARMRDHDEAGPLLIELEHWLHEPKGRHEVDVVAVLAPYHDAPAVPASAMQTEEAVP